MPQNCISSWDAQAASNVVYAYGKLCDKGVAGGLDEKVRKLQIAIFIWHVPELTPQGVANCSWSFAKQGVVHGDVALLLREAAMRTSRDMDAQGVANTLWALPPWSSRWARRKSR
jgi:hypothetical protein